jgi:hypothetical protein
MPFRSRLLKSAYGAIINPLLLQNFQENAVATKSIETTDKALKGLTSAQVEENRRKFGANI